MGIVLSQRQKDILLSIVDIYIKYKKPVSSDDVLKYSRVKASSATIRNDMQKLQRLKYIYQQHTSGGRIPSDRALELYFEIVKDVYSKTEKMLDIPKEYKFYDLNIMIENMSKIVSEILEGMIIFEYPNPRYVFITRCVVTPLTESHYVVTFLTNLGMTISRTVEKYGLPISSELEKMLNKGLSGKSIQELLSAVNSESYKTDDIRIKNMFSMINSLLNEFSRNKYHVTGLEKIISHCKNNIESIESLTMMVENDEIKDKIFDKIEFSNDINIFFGDDLNARALKNFSFFNTSYSLSSNSIGRVLLITDKYKNYEKVYKVLKEYVSRFSEIISKNL
ncbi:heat-inducible transcription repressor HrcA [Tepiditoga spiralis]|uniref:Heat-inducible transcription repressor HrcA n=1 Tax=Tepiditoga spiralis TaxID=2108365 RepID=A0A7G1G294_9BACT|nr:hypothetical protein [Tepiditoga spiralis]BBE30368.1 heat-inducible transcription repressor HrcA [Tepiditoga spiralis]